MAAGCAAAAGSVALFRPGLALYDTVAQYAQVRSGLYDDWHPPAMARLWSLLAPLGAGAAPMLVLQLALYWLGLALIAAALRATGRVRSGWAVLALGAMPLFLGWQGVVLKDAQLVGAALGGVGVIAWWRLRDQAIPLPAIAAAALLFGYAALVRANGVFALAPLVAGLVPQRRPAWRALTAAALVALVIAASAPINHRLLHAEPSGVQKSQPLYDLAGVAVRTGTVLPAATVATVRARGCVTPYFWDPLGDPAACGAAMAPLQSRSAAALYALLARTIVTHPLAYVQQRAAHWNTTERWLVPAHLPGAAPPEAGQPNTLGLADPGPAAAAWQRLSAVVAETPVGWPIVWLTVALSLALAAWRQPKGATRDLALALLASALCLEASFAAVSIASDLRYHLWPMLATALAAILLHPIRLHHAALTLLAAVLVSGLAARLSLPPAPDSYHAMLSWRGLIGTPTRDTSPATYPNVPTAR